MGEEDRDVGEIGIFGLLRREGILQAKKAKSERGDKRIPTGQSPEKRQN